MPKLTILHVVYSLEVGGLENGLVNLINRMDLDRFAHVICCLTRSGALAGRIDKKKDVVIHEMDLDTSRFRFPLLRLIRLFRRFHPDIVHTRGWSAVDAIFAAKLAGVSRVIHGEHGRDASDPQGRNLKRNLIRRAFSPLVDQFITVSDDLRFWLTDIVGIPARKVITIHNGVDTERFAAFAQGAESNGQSEKPQSAQQREQKPSPSAEWLAESRGEIVGADGNSHGTYRSSGMLGLRHELGLSTESVLIGTVGRLDPVKDHKTLLQAFTTLADRNERLHLVIVGDGVMRKEIESEIGSLGLGGRVHLLGERHDIPQLLNDFDIFVLTSVAEGISNTILEAMACGLPVVATRVGGNPELVDQGVTGQLIPVRDVRALSVALLGYVENPHLRRAHGMAARQKAVSVFSLDRMALSYEHCYIRFAAMRRGQTVANLRLP